MGSNIYFAAITRHCSVIAWDLWVSLLNPFTSTRMIFFKWLDLSEIVDLGAFDKWDSISEEIM